MVRTKTTNGKSLLRLDVGEKYPPDAADFQVIIGKEKDGQWYRYKPEGGNNKPVDPKTGTQLRRATVVNKQTTKASARHDVEREVFSDRQERQRKAARVRTANTSAAGKKSAGTAARRAAKRGTK